VVEQALLLGIGVDQTLRYIVDQTAGILFMGTPHDVAELSKWGSHMRKTIPAHIRAAIRPVLEVLTTTSDACQVVEIQFRKESQYGKLSHIKLFSFYETTIMRGFAREIVPKRSAVLPTVPNCPIVGTHVSMVQFEGKIDSEYAKVKNQLIDWTILVGGEVPGGSVLILPVEKLQGQIEDVSQGISMLIA
jgi:hypothetical protein